MKTSPARAYNRFAVVILPGAIFLAAWLTISVVARFRDPIGMAETTLIFGQLRFLVPAAVVGAILGTCDWLFPMKRKWILSGSISSTVVAVGAGWVLAQGILYF
jgi:hypothetical protein